MKILVLIGLILTVLTMAIVSIPSFIKVRQRDAIKPTPKLPTAAPSILPSPTDFPIGTLPPPLEHVDFPTQPISYPADWPTTLKFPDQFILVEAVSGTLPSSTVKTWAAKLRYSGNPKIAATLVSEFFGARGYEMTERTDLDGGGVLLLIGKPNENRQSIIVTDPDPSLSGTTRIIATMTP